jgi:hypothetical protein
MSDADKNVKGGGREWPLVRDGYRNNLDRTRDWPKIRVILWVRHTRLSCNGLGVKCYAPAVFHSYR